MTSPGGDIDDRPRVTVRCQDNGSVGVTFCDRFSFDAYSAHYAVELQASRAEGRWRLGFFGDHLAGVRRADGCPGG